MRHSKHKAYSSPGRKPENDPPDSASFTEDDDSDSEDGPMPDFDRLFAQVAEAQQNEQVVDVPDTEPLIPPREDEETARVELNIPRAVWSMGPSCFFRANNELQMRASSRNEGKRMPDPIVPVHRTDKKSSTTTSAYSSPGVRRRESSSPRRSSCAGGTSSTPGRSPAHRRRSTVGRNSPASSHPADDGTRYLNMEYAKTTNLPRCLLMDSQSTSATQRKWPTHREYYFSPSHSRRRINSPPESFYRTTATEELYTDPWSGVLYYRLRSFNIMQEGVYNLGDTFIRKEVQPEPSGENASAVVPSTSTAGPSTSQIATKNIRKYTVVMLGAPGVGKSALSHQFMTSEYVCAYSRSSAADRERLKTVHARLNGQEIELTVVDIPLDEVTLESQLTIYRPEIVVVVYSIVSSVSLRVAEDLLMKLWDLGFMLTCGVILVGNKADLERSRIVETSEGRDLATICQVKFIETSSGVEHNVDELLVGVLVQAALNADRRRAPVAGAMRNKLVCGLRFLLSLLGLGLGSAPCLNMLTL